MSWNASSHIFNCHLLYCLFSSFKSCAILKQSVSKLISMSNMVEGYLGTQTYYQTEYQYMYNILYKVLITW